MLDWINDTTFRIPELSHRGIPSKKTIEDWNNYTIEQKRAYIKKYPSSWFANKVKQKKKKAMEKEVVKKPKVLFKKKEEYLKKNENTKKPHKIEVHIPKVEKLSKVELKENPFVYNFVSKNKDVFNHFKQGIEDANFSNSEVELANAFHKHFSSPNGSLNKKFYNEFLDSDGNFDAHQFNDYLMEQKKKRKPLEQIDFKEEVKTEKKEKEKKEKDLKFEEPEEIKPTKPKELRYETNDQDSAFDTFKKAFKKSHPKIKENRLKDIFNANFIKENKELDNSLFEDYLEKEGNFDSDRFADVAHQKDNLSHELKKVDSHIKENLSKEEYNEAEDSIKDLYENKKEPILSPTLKKYLKYAVAAAAIAAIGVVAWHTLPQTGEVLGSAWRYIKDHIDDSYEEDFASSNKGRLLEHLKNWSTSDLRDMVKNRG